MLLLGGLLGIDGPHVPFCAGPTLLQDAGLSLLVHCVEDVQPVHVHGPPLHALWLESTQSSPPPQSLFWRHAFEHEPVVPPLHDSAPPHVPQLVALQTPLLHTPLAHCEFAVHTHTLFVQVPPPHWLFFVHAFMPHVPSVAPWHVYDVFAQSFDV